MSKKAFKEQLRARNVSNTPESRQSEEKFGTYFDSNRNRKGWAGSYPNKPDDKQTDSAR